LFICDEYRVMKSLSGNLDLIYLLSFDNKKDDLSPCGFKSSSKSPH